MPYTFSQVRYRGQPVRPPSASPHTESIKTVGIDTEAYTTGHCFMICTSLGDTYAYEDYPQCMFNRKYRNTTFVAYNLKYDMGAFLQFLPPDILRDLWKTGRVIYQDYTIKCIAYKFLRITRKKKDSITVYDMLNFYRGAGVNGSSSLDSVAENMLGERKQQIETKRFTPGYVRKNWQKISEYCIQDAVLVQKLSDMLIRQFEEWGVKPRALYSVAYITYQYFLYNTYYVTVHRFWYRCRELLRYAMLSYNGGKFEVTRKGPGYYYEYDIVSAYPYEIANLVDISTARVQHLPYYDDTCTYAFVKCIITIPIHVYSPIAIKWGSVNIYPVGTVLKIVTKTEYLYLLSVGCTIHVIDAYHLYTNSNIYPYREKIQELFEYKKLYKKTGQKMLYHTVKILLNSLYGKFVQLIKHPDYLQAGNSWNPIYGSIITANVRVRITDMQQKHNSVVAVHTDSIISYKPLPVEDVSTLGGWSFEGEGEGIILGSGIYQIGEISKARGFRITKPLMELCKIKRSKCRMITTNVISWRECAFHGWDINMINRFVTANKYIQIRFDHKRIWIRDYTSFWDATRRVVDSMPLVVSAMDCSAVD